MVGQEPSGSSRERTGDLPGPRLRVGILGPLVVELDGAPVVIASLRQRALLVLLAMEAGRVVSSERLVDRLWDGAPPPQAAVTLRSYVSNLRQALGGPAGAAGALRTRGSGYLLDLPGEALDAARLHRLADRGHEHLRQGRPAEALAAFDEAVALWRGEPLAEVAHHEAAQSSVTALTELYLGAVESRFEALLATGRHLAALPDLEAFTAEHPLREGPRVLHMLALYRAGRTPQALEVHRAFRDLLRDDLGLDPSPRLQTLLHDMLDQAPGLAAPVVTLEPDGPTDAGPRAQERGIATVGQAARPDQPDGQRRSVVGREREVRSLLRHLDRLQGRRTGAVVLLAGEAGIGKTTLLEVLEAEARARRVGVHVGRPPGPTGSPPLWPWTQVVEAVAAELDDRTLRAACSGAGRSVVHLAPVVAERTGQPPPITGDNPQAMRFQLYEAVSVFLRQACPGPTVLLLDDLHWADPSSLELLSYLTPSLAGRELLVVAAFRNLPVDRTPELDATLATIAREDTVDELVLTGLDREQVAEMLSALGWGEEGAHVTDDALVSLTYERTGGNPFFVRQLGRALLDVEPRDRSGAAGTVPSGVRHIISSRLRALSDRTTLLLEGAAVLGREFDLSVAAAAAGLDLEEALDASDEAARHGLVDRSEEAGHRFVHALVQEAVVDSLPPGRRARLHAAALWELERAGGSADQLADHAWRARDVVGARGVPFLLAAARHAMTVFALERAEQHLRHALDLARHSSPPDPDTELVVLLSLLQVITAGRGWGAKEGREVVAHARELAAGGARHPGVVRLWWSVWLSLIDRADVETAAEVAATIADLAAASDDGASLVVAHHTAFFRRLLEGRVEAARDELRASRAVADRVPNEELAAYDEHLGVIVLLNEGYVAAFDDDADLHRAAMESAIALADADGRPLLRALVRTLAATTAVFLPDADYVRVRAAEAIELSSRFGFGWLEVSARCAAAYADAMLGGDLAAATQQITDILAQHHEAGRLGNVPAVLVMLSEVHRKAGRLHEARTCLEQAKERPAGHLALTVDHLDRRLRRLGSTPAA